MVVSTHTRPNMEMGHAITIGRCYKRMDEVRVAMDTFNVTTTEGYKSNNNNNNNNNKDNIELSFI